MPVERDGDRRQTSFLGFLDCSREDGAVAEVNAVEETDRDDRIAESGGRKGFDSAKQVHFEPKPIRYPTGARIISGTAFAFSSR
jgi:hypothetical protein